MATVPNWFDANSYFAHKANAMGVDSLTLAAAFKAAGYGTDPASLYQHFVNFGNAENISPDPLFDAGQYLYSKAASYYKTTHVTANQVTSMMLALDQAGLTAWDHYIKYGSGEGLNPSASFDSAAYMSAKLALVQVSQPTYTMADLEAAFAASGYTPLTHYYDFGKAEGLVATPVHSGTPGATYSLTKGEDSLFGTSGDDFFSAKLGTLGDDDYIDGGAGYDTLRAVVDQNNVATQPTIVNVEKVIFQAQKVAPVSGSNNPTNNNFAVAIDAGRIADMTYLQDDNSRAMLTVEDVRTNSNMMTIAFTNSDQGRDVNFNVLFDQQNLKPVAQTNSGTLNLQLMDVKNADTSKAGNPTAHPLQEQPFTSFTFEYVKADGTHNPVTLHFRAADAALYTGVTATYDTLVTAFQNAVTDLVAAHPEYANIFTVTKGQPFTATATVQNVPYSATGSMVNIASAKGGLSAENAAYPADNLGWGVDAGKSVPSDGRIVWSAQGVIASSCPLIETTIHLDNVGRVQWSDISPDCMPNDSVFGSESGNLLVGAMGSRGGIERFDVKVDRGSWLSSLASTNNTLRYVTVDHADINGDGEVGKNIMGQANDKGYGQLYIGKSMEADVVANASTNLTNMFSWTNRAHLLTTDGLVDVKNFEAAGGDSALSGAFKGNINLGASITSASYAKYLHDVDGTWTIGAKYAPSGNFGYNFGSGNDTLNMTMESGIAADRDVKLVVHGNDGNDLINFSFTGTTILNGISNGPTANQILNMAALRSVVLNGDAGDDKIWSWGNGSVTANGGSGDDAIYVGQNGNEYGLTHPHVQANIDQNAVWVFNAGSTSLQIFYNNVNGAQPLNNDILSTVPTVGFSYSTLGAGAAGTDNLGISVNFKGITSNVTLYHYDSNGVQGAAYTINVGTSGATGYQISTTDINYSIAYAINNDPILNKILVATDGAGYSMMVQSLIDGAMATGDLSVALVDMAPGATVNTLALGGGAYNTAMAQMLGAATALTSGTVTSDIVNAYGIESAVVNLGTAIISTTPGSPFSLTIAGVTYVGETSAAYTAGTSSDSIIINALNGAISTDGHKLSDLWSVSDSGLVSDGNILLTGRSAVSTPLLTTTSTIGLNTYALADATGSNTGTFSINWANAGISGTKGDVVVLNAFASTTDATYHDTIVITDSANVNETVFNFHSHGVGGANAGGDFVNVAALLNAGVSATSFTNVAAGTAYSATAADIGSGSLFTALSVTTTTINNGAYVAASGTTAAAGVITHSGVANGGTAAGSNFFNLVDFTTAMGTTSAAAAGFKGVVFVDNMDGTAAGTSHHYTVFYIQNDANTTLVASEVTLLGTITLANGTAIHSGDLSVTA